MIGTGWWQSAEPQYRGDSASELWLGTVGPHEPAEPAPRVIPLDDSGLRKRVARPPRILIVDDYGLVRRELSNAFTSAGWTVCGEAADGKQAIELAETFRPDVVILDISMPVMSGLAAAPEIMRRVPEAKIIAFTMHDSPQLRQAIRTIGIHGYAVKSAPLEDLLNQVRALATS